MTATPMPSCWTVKVVGMSFVDSYPGNVRSLDRRIRAVGSIFQPRVEIQHDPDNEHDPNAIEVWIALHDVAEFYGHLPRDVAARLAPELDAGGRWEVSIDKVLISDENPLHPGLSLKFKRVNSI